jgi:hypothetical protein
MAEQFVGRKRPRGIGNHGNVGPVRLFGFELPDAQGRHKPIHHRHRKIHEDDVEPLPSGEFHRLRTVGCHRRVDAKTQEQVARERSVIGAVIDDQDAQRCRAPGARRFVCLGACRCRRGQVVSRRAVNRRRRTCALTAGARQQVCKQIRDAADVHSQTVAGSRMSVCTLSHITSARSSGWSRLAFDGTSVRHVAGADRDAVRHPATRGSTLRRMVSGTARRGASGTCCSHATCRSRRQPILRA